MAFTSADLVTIDAAITTGELEVELNGKRVRYRSLKDLKEARALVLAEINQAAAVPFNRQSFASYKRGGA